MFYTGVIQNCIDLLLILIKTWLINIKLTYAIIDISSFEVRRMVMTNDLKFVW